MKTAKGLGAVAASLVFLVLTGAPSPSLGAEASQAIEHLVKNQHQDGSWNPDQSDTTEITTEVLISLADVLGKDSPVVKRGANFLKGFFIDEWDDRPQCRGIVRPVSRQVPRSTPTGKLSGSINALSLTGEVPTLEVLELSKRRMKDGAYERHYGWDESDVRSTVAALEFLARYNPVLGEATATWLAGQQNPDGAFGFKAHGVYHGNLQLTSRVLMALAPFKGIPVVSNSILAGLRYIVSQANPDGSFGVTKVLAGPYRDYHEDTLWGLLALKVLAGDVSGIVAKGSEGLKRNFELGLIYDNVYTALYVRLANWKKPPAVNYGTLRPIPAQKVPESMNVTTLPVARINPANFIATAPTASPDMKGRASAGKSIPKRYPKIGTGFSTRAVTLRGVNDGLCTVHEVYPMLDEPGSRPVNLFALLDGKHYDFGDPVTEEGEHVLEVGSTEAGEKTSETVRFVIDRTDPVVKFSGVSDGGRYKKSVTPEIGVYDDNVDGFNATLNGEPYQAGTPIAARGSYTLEVTAWDCAGNVEAKSVSFVVEATR